MWKWVGVIGIPLMVATTVVAQQPTGNQSNVFRSTIDYFSTHVIVRDHDDKFVPDLRLDEFRVYEDGILQKITNFQPIIGNRAVGGLATAASAAPVMEGLILPATRPNTDSSGRMFIIFIDDLHLQPSDTPRVKDLLKKIRDTLVHENDLVGFVSSGKSSIEIDPAYDYGHRRFNEAINKVMGGGLTPTEILDGAVTEGAEGPTSLRYSAHVAFVTAYDMIEQLSQVSDRRKAFVYVSSGYDFNPFKEARLQKIKDQYTWMDNASGTTNPNDTSDEAKQQQTDLDTLRQEEYNHRTQFSSADLISEVAQLGRAAQRGNVTFYTIDPRGLIAGGDLTLREKISYADWRDLHMTQISTLMSLAEDTGGFCGCMTNDFDKVLRRIDAETSDYYVIGYFTSNPDPLKLRRIVKIDVTRPGLQAPVYKSEYVLPRPSKKSAPPKQPPA